MNRICSADPAPPPEELMSIGITRWRPGDGRFVERERELRERADRPAAVGDVLRIEILSIVIKDGGGFRPETFRIGLHGLQVFW